MFKQYLFVLVLPVFFSLITAQHLQSQTIADSLEKRLKVPVSDSEKLELLTSLSWEYLQTDKKKSWDYATAELVLAQKDKNEKFIASAYNDLGLVLELQGKDRQALDYHFKALAIRNKLGDKKDIGSSWSKIGNCYTELTEYAPALDAQLKALSAFEEINNKPYEARTLNNICVLYEKLGNYDKLEEYAQRSLKIQTEFQDTVAIAGALEHIANVYDHKNNTAKAMQIEKQALQLFSAFGDSSSVASSYIDLGVFSHKLNDIAGALHYYEMARDISVRADDVIGETFCEHNIGSVLIEMKNYKEAEKHLIIAEKLATADTLNDLLIQIYRDKGTLYALTNRGIEAGEYYDKYTRLKDSVFSGDLTSRFSEMQVKYETDKKEKENKILLQEKKLQYAQLAQSRTVQTFLAGIILLVILISYLFYNRYKLRQQRLLDSELLKQQELRSKAIIDTEEHERERIARELHDGVGQQLSAARLNIHGIGPVSLQDSQALMLKNAGELIDQSIQEVRTVSHNLMNSGLLRNGLIAACHDFIDQINSSGKLKIELETIEFPEKTDHTTAIVLFRIIQELVSNIIRHSAASEVEIQLTRDEKNIVLLVQDNGKGFDTAIVSEGIGLQNIKTRVNFLNGEIHFDSSPGNGTTVTVEIPYSGKNPNSSAH